MSLGNVPWDLAKIWRRSGQNFQYISRALYNIIPFKHNNIFEIPFIWKNLTGILPSLFWSWTFLLVFKFCGVRWFGVQQTRVTRFGFPTLQSPRVTWFSFQNSREWRGLVFNPPSSDVVWFSKNLQVTWFDLPTLNWSRGFWKPHHKEGKTLN